MNYHLLWDIDRLRSVDTVCVNARAQGLSRNAFCDSLAERNVKTSEYNNLFWSQTETQQKLAKNDKFWSTFT